MRRLTRWGQHGFMWRSICQLVVRNRMRKHDTAQECDFAELVSAGIHIVHTSTKATSLLLCAAESIARSTNQTIHIHAALPIPYHLELDNPLISVPFMERVLGDCVRRCGSPRRTYAIHVCECRGRTEGLLKRLPSGSLVLLAASWRPWPTFQSRLARELGAAGHCVISIYPRQQHARASDPARTVPEETVNACAQPSTTHTR